MRRGHIVLGFALVLAGLFLWGWMHRAERGAPPPEGPPPVMQWGSGARYDVEVQSDMSLGVSSGVPSPPALRLSGILNLRVASSDAERVCATLRFAPLSCEVLGQFSAEMGERLSAPFTACFARDGRVESVHLSDALPEGERIVAEEVLRAAQVVLSGEESTWTTREAHRTGEYEARYERAPDGTIHKRKLRYLSSPSPVHVEVLSSDMTARLSPTLWLASAQGEETLSASSGGTPLLRTRLTFSLRQISGEPDVTAPPAKVQPARDAPVRPSGVPEETRNSPAGDVPAPGTVAEPSPDEAPFLSLLERFDRHSQSDFEELLAMLRNDPEAGRDVVARILDPRTDDATQATLVNLLGTSGTPEAQRFLLELAGAPGASHMNVLRAIIALGGVASPTEEARSGLWRFARLGGNDRAEDLSHTALLALGAIAATLRGDEKTAAVSRSVVDGLLGVLDGANGPNLRVTLKALGNSGDPAVAERIGSFLASGDPATRVAAATALRRMPGEGTEELLLTSLAAEGVPQVRSALVRSLGTRDPDERVAAALAGSAPKEENAFVRGEMIRALARGSDRFPVAREALQHMLETESNPQNLNLLRRILSRTPAAAP